MKYSYDSQLFSERDSNLSVYKTEFQATCTLEQAFLPEWQGKMLELCGRVTGKRCFREVAFANLYDAGTDVQLVFDRTEHPRAWAFFKKQVSVGDYIGICGTTGKTRNGMDSVFAAEVSLLTKSVSPLPDKYHGVCNSQVKRQSRYLEVLGNRDSYRLFQRRSEIQQAFRGVLLRHGYLEMDTPVLSSVPCASNARQFEAHHNDLDCSVYLRVSAELALKQLVMCGYNRVFEFCKNFRNEGTDRYHRQEFLNLECYCAYATIGQMKELVGELLASCSRGQEFIQYQGQTLSVKQIPTFHVHQVILERSGIDILELNRLEELKSVMLEKGIITLDQMDELGNRNACVNRLIDRFIQQQGFFYLEGYPADLYPLCRLRADDSSFADMEYLFLNGLCLAQFCGEETDPYRQRHMLEQQARQSVKSVPADQAFLTAINYGMPPTCGVGISMERMIMLLCDCPSIYESNFFHLAKP